MTKQYSPYPILKVRDDINDFTKNYGFRRIHFQDDNFFIDRNRVLKIAAQVLTGKALTWWANIRANVCSAFNNGEIESLIESGMNTLFIGVESGSQRMLDNVNKGTVVEDIIRTNDILKKYNVELHLSYMFGVPGENIEDLRLTIKQIKFLKKENKNVRIQTCFYQPYPGTELYGKALALGYLKRVGLESWSKIKSQENFNRLPWLSRTEMIQYGKEFTNFFKHG